ncbi:MAG: hypothetical protein LH660_00700 [Phormidesmis sp. CAN_BIN36]|nr:hypothetical protein [Phormidesmis sp. CAN_BIN36]
MQAVSHWYELEAGEVLRQLGSDTSQGLSAATVSQRLIQYGLDELREQSSKSIWRIVWQQLTATMVLLLIGGDCAVQRHPGGAAGISGRAGDRASTVGKNTDAVG